MLNRKGLLHSCLERLEAEDDEYVFAGRKITDIANLVGNAPFYAYDLTAMTRKYSELKALIPDYIDVHYAIKANPHPDVVAHMATLVDGLDVASAGELKVAINTAIPAREISFAGPGKSIDDLSQAIIAGVTLNVESMLEIERISGLGEQYGKTPRVAVRVNPDFELKTSGMKMSGGPKQFGIDSEIVPEALQRIAHLGLDFQGFHIFSGSQNLRADAISESQQKAVDLAITLSEFAPSPIKTLNIGGGFGIPYFSGEKPLDIEAVAQTLSDLEPKINASLPDVNVVVELGRYLVGEAGIYVCKVVDRKISRGEIFLVTNGGLHHHLAASGNFGQVIRKNYPVFVGNRVKGEGREICSVVGPLCTPLDLLADKMEMARADVDDLIVVMQSGAYGATASPQGFLSHPPPAEIVI